MGNDVRHVHRIGFNKDRIAVAVCVRVFPASIDKNVAAIYRKHTSPRTELPTETERAEVGLITSLLSPCLVVIRGKSGLIVEFEKPATGSHGRLTVCVSRVGPAVTQACFGGWKNRDGINSVTLIFSTRWFIEFLSSVFFPD